MRFTLLVLTPPDVGTSPRHALAFAKTALAAGHELACVFFYDQGASTALAGTEGAQDELNIRQSWSDLGAAHDLRLLACVSSASRFGVTADGSTDSLREGFQIGSLGDLMECSVRSERLLTFGG